MYHWPDLSVLVALQGWTAACEFVLFFLGGAALEESEVKSCIKRAMLRGTEVQSLYKALET